MPAAVARCREEPHDVTVRVQQAHPRYARRGQILLAAGLAQQVRRFEQ